MQNRGLFSIVATTLALTSCFVACAPKSASSPIQHPVLSGHRGAAFIAPENTMASMDSSIVYGIEFAECDVCISKDSVFYLMHDYAVDRTTNGTGKIVELNSSYIDSLDAGSWFGAEFADQRVPRFSDVLKRAKEGGLKLTIDYRNGDLQALYNLIESEGMMENCTFVMPEKSYFAFRKIAPDNKGMQAYITGAAALEESVAKWQPNIAVVRLDSLTQPMVDRLHQLDIKVLALSLMDEDPDTIGYAKVLELGVDVLATDRADYYAKKYPR